jgi:hypothetical protein
VSALDRLLDYFRVPRHPTTIPEYHAASLFPQGGMSGDFADRNWSHRRLAGEIHSHKSWDPFMCLSSL